MSSPGLGQKRIKRNESTVSIKELPRQCSSFFLDSGAHSLFNAHIREKSKGPNRFKWYWKGDRWTKQFEAYLDNYASFIQLYGGGIDYYANVDVIYSPELSWKSQKYLESCHGLNPIPVIHSRTSLKWLEKHLEFGYDYIGVGGLGQEDTRSTYVSWADSIFNRICNNPKRLPSVRVHGFAIGSTVMMRRYPWYSVDSASAYSYSGNGWICIPHKRKGKFTFDIDPYIIGMSDRSSARKKAHRHYYNLSPRKQAVVREWLELIDVPLGKREGEKVIEYGVISEYHARAVACLRFYQMLVSTLPKWPWSFGKKVETGFYPLDNLR